MQWYDKGWQHIWLPYAQMQTTTKPLPVVSAKGVYLELENGQKLIDGISSWWCVCHGHNHPKIVNAITTQAKQLTHVMFAGLAHEPAYRLASRLAAITPGKLSRVFFSDSGSTSVEVAMKMAIQFWQNYKKPQKNKFVAFSNGYHGDTMGAMSLADMNDGMHKAFAHYTPKQFTVDIPSSEHSFIEFEALIKDIHKEIAAVIIEPLFQGAGGMKFHSPDTLAEIYRIAKKYDVLFIADEIATGFGRTGYMFACEEANITPDILCLGKAITGGSMTLAATLATDDIFDAFLSDKLETAFMHGPTYMANPVACAAANASLDLFEQEPYLKKIETIEKQLQEELVACCQLPNVVDVRVKGAIGIIQLANTSWDDMFAMRKTFVDMGIWLRPFADVIYVMPPFTIKAKELQRITDAIYQLLANQ